MVITSIYNLGFNIDTGGLLYFYEIICFLISF